MGRMIDVYDGPLSREDYAHLKARESQFLIAENVKHFGPIGEDWEPLPEDEQDEFEVEETEVAGNDAVDDASEYDPDDIEFVRNLSYPEVQQNLKERGINAGGQDEVLRGRLLNALRDAANDGDLEEDNN